MYTLYGIANCDTVKKALRWLHENNVSVQLHDFKKEGISIGKLEQWCAQAGVNKILNPKSTTWRSLTDKEKAAAADLKKALQLLTEKTSLIKRPVLERDGKLIAVGFDAAVYAEKIKPA